MLPPYHGVGHVGVAGGELGVGQGRVLRVVQPVEAVVGLLVTVAQLLAENVVLACRGTHGEG